jgi:hypothetical protein
LTSTLSSIASRHCRSRKYGRDSFCKTAMPDRKNVSSRIHVAVMHRAAIAAGPFSYSKTFAAFGASATIAPTAGLGGMRFVDLLEPHACASALVPKHGSQRAPASVQNAFRVLGTCHRARADVAYEDGAGSLHDSSAVLMQEILPAVGDLGVDRARTISLLRALRDTKCVFEVAVEAGSLNRAAVAHRDQLLQSEVNAQRQGRQRSGQHRADHFGYFDSYVQIPVPASVLCEIACAQLAVISQAPAVSQCEPAASKVNLTVSVADRAHLERHPPEAATRASARTPRQPHLPALRATSRVLLRCFLYRLDWQHQCALSTRSTFEEWPEVEASEKLALAREDFLLELVAIVPNSVHVARQGAQAWCMFIFDANPQRSHTTRRGTALDTVHKNSIRVISRIAKKRKECGFSGAPAHAELSLCVLTDVVSRTAA